MNVDVAVTGSDFEASASPLLQTALLRVLERVVDPTRNKTLRAVWAEKGSMLGGLGAGSEYVISELKSPLLDQILSLGTCLRLSYPADMLQGSMFSLEKAILTLKTCCSYVAFQDLAGTSSLDMTFKGGSYPYHSCYDNLEWMDTVGDPGFVYHKAMAQLWALLILELADRELLPFDFKIYAEAVKGYVDDLQSYAKAKGPKGGLDLTSLHQAAEDFTKNAAEFHAWSRAWEDTVGQGYETSTLFWRLDALPRTKDYVFIHISLQTCVEDRNSFLNKC